MTSNGHESGKPLRAGDPRELDGYRIVSRLGRGGMGTVYLAKDAAERSVAIKLIHPDLADDESFRLRFAREVDSARRVARFSTAGVIDARLEGEPLFIASEYVPGPNLDEAVRGGTPMHGGTLEGLAMGVAAALTAIHGSGIVHRDLKPANVLLSPVGPKVIDFGIARALDDTGGAVTRSSQLMGTPSYMAPELILGEQATAAADIFAWGCLVAFAGTGKAPFDAATVPAVLHNISSAPPKLDGLDPSLLDLVSSALDKEPGNRPTSQQILARLTGQSEPEESEVRRTISTSWAPPSSAPVPGLPPEDTQAGQGQAPAGGSTRPAGQPTDTSGQPTQAGVQSTQAYTQAQPPVPHDPQMPPPQQGQPYPPGNAPQQGQPGQQGQFHNPHLPPQQGMGQGGPGPQGPHGHYPQGPYGPSGGQPPFPQSQQMGHPPHGQSPSHGQAVFGAQGGSGGPGQPPTAQAAANGADGSARGRRKLVLIGGAAAAVVLLIGVGATALFSGSEAPPEDITSIYATDFATDPDWISNRSFDQSDPEHSDGYWEEQNAMVLQLDPDSNPSRGEVVPFERETPEHVLIETNVAAMEGPGEGQIGVRCWDQDGDEERTQYEALLRFDGEEAQIRRVTEESGDNALAETTDVGGFETYDLYDERSSVTGLPYDVQVADLVTNNLKLSCEYVNEEDEDPYMDLNMWVNDSLVLSATDENPLPDDGDLDDEDRRRVGAVMRPSAGTEPLTAAFTDYALYRINVED
ncbi:serine/threonine-protein kinase [Nocardiopsis oceani]